jgi:hypothetical protein
MSAPVGGGRRGCRCPGASAENDQVIQELVERAEALERQVEQARAPQAGQAQPAQPPPAHEPIAAAEPAQSKAVVLACGNEWLEQPVANRTRNSGPCPLLRSTRDSAVGNAASDAAVMTSGFCKYHKSIHFHSSRQRGQPTIRTCGQRAYVLAVRRLRAQRHGYRPGAPGSHSLGLAAPQPAAIPWI